MDIGLFFKIYGHIQKLMYWSLLQWLFYMVAGQCSCITITQIAPWCISFPQEAPGNPFWSRQRTVFLISTIAKCPCKGNENQEILSLSYLSALTRMMASYWRPSKSPRTIFCMIAHPRYQIFVWETLHYVFVLESTCVFHILNDVWCIMFSLWSVMYNVYIRQSWEQGFEAIWSRHR